MIMHIGWTTIATLEEAEKLASEAVNERLAACAQVDGPIRSYYLWQDNLERDEEYRITFKFLAKNAGKFEIWLKEKHPYELPQWITVEAEHVMSEYLQWAKGNACSQIISGPSNFPGRVASAEEKELEKGRKPPGSLGH